LKFKRSLVYIIIILVCSKFSFAQQTTLIINPSDKKNNNTNTSAVSFYNVDSVRIYKILDSIQSVFYSKGHILSSMDSMQWSDSLVTVVHYVGDQFYWKTLQSKNPSPQINGYNEMPISLDQLNLTYNELLLKRENEGYPLDNIQPTIDIIDSSFIALSIEIDSFHKIYFDTIEVKGSTNISYDFIAEYLDIERGAVYDKEKLLLISQKINRLAYLNLVETPLVVFYGNQAKIVLKLKQEKNNVFDFLIGILPQSDGESSKWLITGDMTLSLYNKLGVGENLYFHYKRYKASSSDLNLEVDLPYLKYIPVGIRSKFNLLKEADNYLNINSKFGIQYQYGFRKYYLDWNYRNSRLLSIDSMSILLTKQLPKELDYVYNGFSMAMEDRKLDHQTNPRRGYQFYLEFGLGQKKTLINENIIQLSSELINFSKLYDSLQTTQLQYNLSGKYQKYIPIWDRSVFVTGLLAQLNYNSGNLLENEKIRIGGAKNLRGFDEESLLVSMIGLMNLEYRLLLSQDSYLSFPFIDFAITKIDLQDNSWDHFIGFGGGLSFQTTAGLFNFSIAIGKSNDIPIDFKRPKVHFGYLNVF